MSRPIEEVMVRDVEHQLFGVARQAAPLEACGLLEWDGTRMTVHTLLNVAEDPETSFLCDPYEQRHALTGIFERGTELWALWHSHPTQGALPSERDRSFAKEIGSLQWVIVGLEPAEGEPTIWIGHP